MPPIAVAENVLLIVINLEDWGVIVVIMAIGVVEAAEDGEMITTIGTIGEEGGMITMVGVAGGEGTMIVGVAGDGEIGEAGEVVLIARGFTFIGELMFVALKFDYHMYTS